MPDRPLPVGANLNRFWGRVDRSGSCWTWLGKLGPNKYGVFKLKGYPELAHRLSYRLECGEIPKGMLVCHKCDNPRCVRPDHLFVGTHADNMVDMVKKGRWAGRVLKSTSEPLHRINQEIASAIKQDMIKGMPNSEISVKHKVPQNKISAIRTGKSWAWVVPSIIHLELPITSERLKRAWVTRKLSAGAQKDA